MKNLLLNLLFSVTISLCLSSAVKSQDSIVFDESFNDNRNNWSEFNTSLRISNVENGKLLLHNKSIGTPFLLLNKINFDRNSDFTITSQVNLISGKSSAYYGLVYSYLDENNYFTFQINSAGNYVITKNQNEIILVISNEFTKAIKQTQNKIEIKKRGETIHFYVNETEVVELPYELQNGELLGFVLSEKVICEVQNLIISGIKDSQIINDKEKPQLIIENPVFSSNDQVELMAGNSGKVSFIIKNNSNYEANNVQIRFACLNQIKGFNFPEKYDLGSLSANAEKKISLTVEVGKDVGNEEVYLRIDATNNNFYNCVPNTLKIPIIKFQNYSFAVTSAKFNDKNAAITEFEINGNGNSMIEPGESVEITSYLTNTGRSAKNIQVKIIQTLPNTDLQIAEDKSTIKIGNLNNGDSAKIVLHISSTKKFRKKEIPLIYRISHSESALMTEIAPAFTMSSIFSYLKEKAKIEANTKSTVSYFDSELANNGNNYLAIIVSTSKNENSNSFSAAKNDAINFYRFVKNFLGVPEENIVLLLSVNSYHEFKELYQKNGWICSKQNESPKDVIVYFSTEGEPDTSNTTSLQILYSLYPGFELSDKFYRSVNQCKVKSLTVFGDICLSGDPKKHIMSLSENAEKLINLNGDDFQYDNFTAFFSGNLNYYGSKAFGYEHLIFSDLLYSYFSENINKEIVGKTLFEYFINEYKQSNDSNLPVMFSKNPERVLFKY